MNKPYFKLIGVLALALFFSVGCESSDDDSEEVTAGEVTAGEAAAGEAAAGEAAAGEAAAGEAAAGEAAAGEAAAGEAAAGEAEAGEAAAGEAEAGEASGGRISAQELADLVNAAFTALEEAQGRLCEACPDDSYCNEGQDDMPVPVEEAECVLANTTDEQYAVLVEQLTCQNALIEDFAACTAEPVCDDDSFFECFSVLFNEEACPEPEDVDPPELGVACFGETACADGSGSYSEESICDGYEDCADGSDEANCEE